MVKELLFSITKKDFEIQTFRSGGPGGQNQNKVSSGVRIIHKDSGAVGESRAERSQLQNKHLAFEHLVATPAFQKWLKLETSRVLSESKESVDDRVNRMMSEENIKVEYL